MTRRLTMHLQDQLGSAASLPKPLSAAVVLQQAPPTIDTEQRIPLTW